MRRDTRSNWCWSGWILTLGGAPIGPMLLFLGFALSAPLASAVEFGGDEHYELIKGFLCSLGFDLYTEIWNDQPPFHTGVLSLLFQLFGPSVLVARLLTVGLVAVLIATFFRIIRERTGTIAGWIAVIGLLAAPQFMELGVSVMLEPVTFAIGWASVGLLFGFFKRGPVSGLWGGLVWLLASGFVMGLALQTKLTAAMLLPAIGVELVLHGMTVQGWIRWRGRGAKSGEFGGGFGGRFKRIWAPLTVVLSPRGEERGQKSGSNQQSYLGDTRGGEREAHESLRKPDLRCDNPSSKGARSCDESADDQGSGNRGVGYWRASLFGFVRHFGVIGGIWVAGLLCGWGAVYLFFPGESLDLLWVSHFSEETTSQFQGPAGVHDDLFDYIGLTIPALLGVLWLLWRRHWEMIFPVVLLVTAYVVHTNHRPYWPYYYLHFSIPLAWLAAVAIHGLFLEVWEADFDRLKRFPFGPVWGLLIWSMTVSVFVVDLPFRYRQARYSLRAERSIQDLEVVDQMRRYRNRTEWAYAEDPIYAFYARIPVPPEVAVVPRKRRVSGRITDEEIVGYLRDYRPGLIVSGSSRSEAMDRLLESAYREVWSGGHSLYLRKDMIARERTRTTRKKEEEGGEAENRPGSR